MILTGDIGGTKTVLALFAESSGQLREVRCSTFASADYASFEEILGEFRQVREGESLRAAVVGVAGAVYAGRCRTTNLPWTLDERYLARVLGVRAVKLLNDLEAAAYGILCLPPGDYVLLNKGALPRRRGNIAVIAPGTGTGEAILYWDGRDHQTIASEGGHADFAPRTDQEIALLQYLRTKLGGRVSYERVLAGAGIHNIYQFLRDSRNARESQELADAMREEGDPAAAITQAGLAETDALCTETLELFSSILGAEAGNLALKCLAHGGVFVGGGIAPKVLPVLQNGSFMRGFTEKGRFRDLLEGIEVRIALNSRAPLLGAAQLALRMLEGE